MAECSKHPDHFFKYCTAKTAMAVLRGRKIRWNSPLNFNDPFDCYFSMAPRFDVTQFAVKHREAFYKLLLQDEEPDFVVENEHAPILSKIRKVSKGKSRESLHAMLGDVFDTGREQFEKLASEMEASWKRQIAEYRILCVCEINDNPILWAHYSEQHTGVVLQFDCLADLDVPLLVAKRVNYSSKAPSAFDEDELLKYSLGLKPMPKRDGIWQELVTTKAEEWRHEKEWRCVTTRRHYENQGFEDCRFFPREIARVFLGCRITPSDRSEILGLLDGDFKHVEVYQARLHSKMYRLEFDLVRGASGR